MNRSYCSGQAGSRLQAADPSTSPLAFGCLNNGLVNWKKFALSLSEHPLSCPAIPGLAHRPSDAKRSGISERGAMASALPNRADKARTCARQFPPAAYSCPMTSATTVLVGNSENRPVNVEGTVVTRSDRRVDPPVCSIRSDPKLSRFLRASRNQIPGWRFGAEAG